MWEHRACLTPFDALSYSHLTKWKTLMGIHERITTIVSTKGQVILPKAIRDHRQWAPGTRLSVEETADGVLLKATPLFEPRAVGDVFGSLRPKGPALSLDDMDAAVAAEAKRRARG